MIIKGKASAVQEKKESHRPNKIGNRLFLMARSSASNRYGPFKVTIRQQIMHDQAACNDSHESMNRSRSCSSVSIPRTVPLGIKGRREMKSEIKIGIRRKYAYCK